MTPKILARRSQTSVICFGITFVAFFLSVYYFSTSPPQISVPHISRPDTVATLESPPIIEPIVNVKPPVIEPVVDVKPKKPHPDTIYPPTTTTTDPVRAVFVILVRNRELDDIKSSITQLEARFNRKYNYPYVFLNDDDFTEEFKRVTTSLTNAKTQYGKVDKAMWSWPSWVNETKARGKMADMEKDGILYGGSESYRHMCRFQSGFFFRHPLLDPFDYYWRVEPDVDFTCDIDYDVFRFMKEQKIKYGFTMTFREYMATIPSLWGTVMDFRRKHSDLLTLPENETIWKFVTDDEGQTYNACHFWTNFEIASLDIWRTAPYLKFFNFLDQSGGFFYERWGDAPVHSIAAAMFLRKEELHFFNDIGYRHTAYQHCPTDPKVHAKCQCNEKDNHDFDPGWSCLPLYLAATQRAYQ